MVLPIHACVPGRVRWHVRGLLGDAALLAVLEEGLAAFPGVHAARGSTATGNLLVTFDPAVPPERIRDYLTALVRGDVAPSSAPDARDWHARSADAVAAELRTSPTAGLTAAQAQERLVEHGANALPSPPARSAFAILLDQFRTLPISLLAVAGVLSLATGGIVEAAAILGVVGFNGVLGVVVEGRSERIIRNLGTGGQEPAHVIRDGVPSAVTAETVVPGDVIALLPGTVVPADARVMTASDLRLGEATLTGETLPVAKQAEPVGRAAALGDRASMVYRGTAVTGGSGTAVVVAIGMHTEVGRIQRLAGSASTPQTPMQLQLDRLGRQLVWASLAACGAVMGVGALRGLALLQVVRSGLSLAVAAVPEGLPMVATTTLALGIEDMRKRGVLVRRLDAIETLASVDVVCFDKTGTLTLNQMRVAELASGGRRFRADPDGVLLDADGQLIEAAADPDTDPLARLLRVAALCSDAELAEQDGRLVPTGSATEAALLRMALDSGLDIAALRRVHPLAAVRHRTEGYRFMATAHRQPDTQDLLVAVKGSPEEVLDLCGWELRDGERRRLTAARRSAIGRANAAMAGEALRVLGFAFGGADEEWTSELAVPVDDLTWVGLAGMADPVRPGMNALMGALHEAGLRTVMITGDQVATARAVARQLGLAGSGDITVFDAVDLDRLGTQAAAMSARQAHVFARVSPAQKLGIVRVLQAAGERVAMTGDGINDSPALKAADVGIAMGGTASSEAAREVADLVLPNDDLAALAVAVERGRATATNVRKSIRYLLGTNLSEILVVLGATAAGFSEPLTAMQLLWINLVSDVLPGLGLAFEQPDPDLMQGPPRTATTIAPHGDLRRLGAEGGLIATGALGAMAWGALRHGAGPQARTMAFGSLVTAQLLHALTCRSDHIGLFTEGSSARPPNRPLTGLLLASAGVQAAGLFVPGLRRALGVVPLGAADLMVTAAAGVAPYLANETLKAARGRVPG